MPEAEATATTQTAPATTGTTAPVATETAPAQAETTTPAMDITKYINSDGTFKEGWKEAFIPEDQRGNKFYNIFSDVQGFLKSAGNQATMIGKYASTKGILPINEKSTPMEIQAYREAMGIPNDSTGYKYTPSEGMNIDPALLKPALDDFNKSNYTPAQVDVAMKAYERYIGTLQANYEKQMSENVKEASEKVENKWGPKLPQRQELSKSFITKMTANFSPEEYESLFGKEVEFQNAAGVMEKTREGGINAPEFALLRPILLDMFANIEEKYGIEDSALIEDANSPEAISVEEQIKELQTQIADGKLRGSVNPRDRERHQDILDKISSLTKRLPAKTLW
jgi:hypothetical protein